MSLLRFGLRAPWQQTSSSAGHFSNGSGTSRRGRLLPRFAALIFAAVCVVAQAVEPNLGQISPIGVQRGTEVEMTFPGQRLADAKQLLFYSPGFEVKELKAEADNNVV